MELVLQALETHPLSNEFNTIFFGAECASFERLEKLLNNATLRASKRLPNSYTDHGRHQQVKTPKGNFIQCSFHSRNGQRCSHTDEQCRDPRNRNSSAFYPAKKGTYHNRYENNRNRSTNNDNKEIKYLLTALLRDKHKTPTNFKKQYKKSTNVANSTSAQELIAELN